MTVENDEETKIWLRNLTIEERQNVLEAIIKCGCACHSLECLHFLECCAYTYVKMFDITNP